jgi:hypothetical protein
MFGAKFFAIATAALAAALIAAPATVVTAASAYADDCGDPGQPPCTGPVPTVDQVVAVMAELTDPDKPAADKTDIVSPGFTPDEAGTIDDHLHRMDGRELPLNFTVTDIQPAPANLAGATVQTWGWLRQWSQPGPIVLADQGGHWLITHDTAMRALHAYWVNATRYIK